MSERGGASLALAARLFGSRRKAKWDLSRSRSEPAKKVRGIATDVARGFDPKKIWALVSEDGVCREIPTEVRCLGEGSPKAERFKQANKTGAMQKGRRISCPRQKNRKYVQEERACVDHVGGGGWRWSWWLRAAAEFLALIAYVFPRWPSLIALNRSTRSRSPSHTPKTEGLHA
jgi:hypothetical protein